MSPKLRAASLAAVSFCVFAAAAVAAPSFASGADNTPPISADRLTTETISPENAVAPLPVPAMADEAETAERTEPVSLRALVDASETESPLSDEEECLAGAVYFEARNEALEGQHAVADVIINRAESGRFPSTMCGVVFQPSQFSFVRGRQMPAINRASTDWREAVAVSRIAMQDRWESAAPKALFFHAARVSPRWKLKRVATVGNHVFYR